ncbi:MAG TPA: acylphosphatase [Candidatus Eremiobacteraceae bacterium]|nr:acylphosphatase [Candidatus Eremiobacteraceae bacterium]
MGRLHAIIRGSVQGVFFRASVVEQARSLGLVGWVRNRHDGSVECVAEGDPESLLALRAYCENGPPGARVVSVETIDEPETGGFTSFAMRSSG